MQNTKKSKEAQGVGTAQQMLQQFNIASTELHEIFSYEDAKESINALLSGWIGHEFIENTSSLERINTFDFFQELSNHLQEHSKCFQKKRDHVFLLEDYTFFLQRDRKKSNLYFEETIYCFLCSESADDLETRSNAVYHLKCIREYVNKIFEIKKINPKNNT